ncbi:hypothetical protein QFZ87_001118 [Bacillus sp. SLBN-46]|uniref:hypothetical protein n=1 Tax=Bacillus sp. SLBN-46 TaxID=3042283 RepID=UPI00285E96B4|nr:hypothetical protein [Bacillus sp. SLBN-46]MDR6121521.1 hypothetical protein [Bacillus sp. SLBN-46]
MIDWYVILFLAIVLLIFHMGEFAGHKDAAAYVRLAGKNKVSTGTVSMLFRFLTGTFVFVPVYLTVSRGYLAGLVVSIAGVAVLLWFSRKVSQMNDNFTPFQHIGALLRERMPERGRAAVYVLLFLAGSEGLLLSTALANSFMKTVFSIQPIWTSSILFFFVFVFSGMGGAGGVQKMGRWLLFGFFTGITILPVATILYHGVASIHERFVRLPGASWDEGELVVAALLFMVFTAGHLLVYFLLSSDLLAVKRTRLKATIGLTAICWSSMPVAVSVIVVYLMSRGGGNGINGLLNTMGHAFSTPLLYVLAVSVLSCLALSLGVSLHHLMGLLIPLFKEERATYKGYAASLVLCLLFYGASFALDFTTVFIFYIHLFVSICLPLWLLLGYRVRWGWELSLVLIASNGLGLWISFTSEILTGVSVNLGISSAVLFFLFIRKVRTM